MGDDPGKRSLFEDIFGFTGEHGDRVDVNAIDRAARCIVDAIGTLGPRIEPGTSTGKLADSVYDRLRELGVDSGVIIRVSPEEVVWHGLPGKRVLLENQIVTLDAACSLRGWWADIAITLPVGELDEKHALLLAAAKIGVRTIAERMKAGEEGSSFRDPLRELSQAYGVSLVREAGGHRIGRRLHEEPLITYSGDTFSPLQAGCTYTSEPIFTTGYGEVAMAPDGSAITVDGEPAAHFEVTVLTLPRGSQVLGAPGWL